MSLSQEIHSDTTHTHGYRTDMVAILDTDRSHISIPNDIYHDGKFCAIQSFEGDKFLEF